MEALCICAMKIQSVRWFGVARARWCVQMRRTSCGGGLLWYDSWLVLQGQGGKTAVWRCRNCTGKTSSVWGWLKINNNKVEFDANKKCKCRKQWRCLGPFLRLISNCWLFGRFDRLDRGCQGAKISESISSGLQGSDGPYNLCLSESIMYPGEMLSIPYFWLVIQKYQLQELVFFSKHTFMICKFIRHNLLFVVPLAPLSAVLVWRWFSSWLLHNFHCGKKKELSCAA